MLGAKIDGKIDDLEMVLCPNCNDWIEKYAHSVEGGDIHIKIPRTL